VTLRAFALVLALGALAACTKPGSGDVLSGGESMLKLRSAQTRTFETSDRNRVMRGVVATLQDMGFMVTGADAALGTVSGRKFTADSTGQVYELRVTVTVRARDERQMLVRANAEFNNKPVEDPAAYQNFFNALGRSIFLAASKAD
jgi:hypothetical protein